MRDDILDRAQVLCCTCIGSGHELLDGRNFVRVLIDEATQATEPSTLVPIVKGARQVFFWGKSDGTTRGFSLSFFALLHRNVRDHILKDEGCHE